MTPQVAVEEERVGGESAVNEEKEEAPSATFCPVWEAEPGTCSLPSGLSAAAISDTHCLTLSGYNLVRYITSQCILIEISKVIVGPCWLKQLLDADIAVLFKRDIKIK